MIEAIKAFLCCFLKEAGVWFLLVTELLLSAECKPYGWDDIKRGCLVTRTYCFLVSLLAHRVM